MKDKLYKHSRACYTDEGVRGFRSGARWDFSSEVKNRLSYFILLIAKHHIHVWWVLWILETVYATLRILSQLICQVVKSLTISGEAQRKRRLCIRTGLQYKLLCPLAIELEAFHEGGDAGQSLWQAPIENPWHRPSS